MNVQKSVSITFFWLICEWFPIALFGYKVMGKKFLGWLFSLVFTLNNVQSSIQYGPHLRPPKQNRFFFLIFIIIYIDISSHTLISTIRYQKQIFFINSASSPSFYAYQCYHLVCSRILFGGDGRFAMAAQLKQWRRLNSLLDLEFFWLF